jgi:hypothetical protein
MTNESVEAVVNGLEPTSTNIIGSICCVAEVPLALLEYADRVIALDINPQVLKLALRNVNYISTGDYQSFIKQMFLRENRKYFSVEGRLDKIKEKLDCLEVIKGDVFRELSSSVDKMYLSNALTFAGGRTVKVRQGLELVAEILPSEGLAYFSGGYNIYDAVRMDGGLPEKLSPSDRLTNKAKEHEKDWRPLVLRKRYSKNRGIYHLVK